MSRCKEVLFSESAGVERKDLGWGVGAVSRKSVLP